MSRSQSLTGNAVEMILPKVELETWLLQQLFTYFILS